MSVKISELPILDSLADNDVIAGVDTSANVTSKIEMATLKNYIDTNTQYTAGTNIDITNNVVSAPNVYNKNEMDNQIEELQSEVDSLSTIFNAFPTESGEGESVTLDDTAEVKFKKFNLKGNTSQTGTPTPSSPIPVNVVSGDNEINVVGKNLFEIKTPDYIGQDAWASYGQSDYTKNNNGYTLNQRYVGIAFQFNNLEIGSQYTISFDVVGNSSFWASVGINVYSGHTETNTGSQDFYTNTTTSHITYTFTASGNNRIAFNSGYTDNTTLTISNIQLEKGSSATTYEECQGINTYSINLGSLELCKIGNYQDYFYKDSGKWYLYKEIGKVVLNGSESGWSYPSANRFNLDNVVDNYLKRQDYITYLSNYYEAFKQSIDNSVFNTLTTNKNYGFNLSSTPANNYTIRIKDTRYTSMADFKSCLSTNNVKIYYILATPTNTEITYQPLIDQLNLLEKAMSKENQTNISQVSNDKPFIICAEAIKSLENVLDRLELLES